MLVNHNINNLSGGVSRQPDEARFDNQVEEMVNYEPFVTGSIRRRNPLESVATITPHEDNMVVHSYDRGDGLEKYQVIINPNGMFIYDLEGTSRVVQNVGADNPINVWKNQTYNMSYVSGDVSGEYSTINGGPTPFYLIKKDNGETFMVNVWAGDVDPSGTTNIIAGYLYNNGYSISSDNGMAWLTIEDLLLASNTEVSISIYNGNPVTNYHYYVETTGMQYNVTLTEDEINYADDLKFLTVGDTTWILNNKQAVGTTAELSPILNARERAFYWVKRSFDDGSDGGYDYTITVNGVTFTTNSIDSETAALALSNLVNQRYNVATNDPVTFPDYIRAVATGSIVYIYVAKIYAPKFRLHTGTTKVYVRVKNIVTGIVSGVSVTDYSTSFDIISGKTELFCTPTNLPEEFYNLTEVDVPTTLNVPYYTNASQASSNTSPTSILMDLYVTSEDVSFEYSSSDSWGDQASVGWKDTIAKITDLPSSMGTLSETDVGIIEISGTDKDQFTSYYLKWNGDNWTETIQGGLVNTLDLTTLPAKLVRGSDGTFKFGFNENLESEGFYTEWNQRRKGDDDSNPLASFIGYPLSNMFFFRNRLGFTSDENVILSEVGSYYNFFATTVLEVLDGDPIDVSVDSDAVSILRNVSAVAGSLTLWADNAQFVLSGGDILSPATTRVSKSSSYACDNSIKPIVIDNEVLFFNKVDDELEVKSYSAASINTDKSTAQTLTANIEGYLPSTISRVVGATGSNLVFLLDSANPKQLFVYKYHINNNEKILSSWFKWEFESTIKELNVVDNILFLLIDTEGFAKISLAIKDLEEVFLDLGVTPYSSQVQLSKFNLETKQGTRNIREPFYVKNLKISREGYVDLDIINQERNSVKTINSKHLDRRLFIGGNSEKIALRFSTNASTGCKINTLSLEGLVTARSRNK